MKKFAVLTSILALAACGGGSGGHHDGVPVDVPVINNGMVVSDAARASNQEITSMESEILVANGSAATPETTRSSSVVRDNVKYTAYHLDDVEFNIAGFTNGMAENDTLEFDIDDNGQITELEWNHRADGAGDDDEDEDWDQELKRTKNNTFIQKEYKYQVNIPNGGYRKTDSLDKQITDRDELRAIFASRLDGDSQKEEFLNAFDNCGKNGIECSWVEEIHEYEFRLKGKELGKNLKYMDFGYVKLMADGYDDDFSTIFGGYDVKKIDPSKFKNQKLEFKGTAVGAAAYSANNKYNSKQVETAKDATTLTFDKGRETLVMPFNDYYTVTVDKNGNNATLSFTDYKGDDDGYKFDKETDISTANAADRAHVRIQYYGDNGKPTEAGGTVAHEEGNKTFEAAFGGVAK